MFSGLGWSLIALCNLFLWGKCQCNMNKFLNCYLVTLRILSGGYYIFKMSVYYLGMHWFSSKHEAILKIFWNVAYLNPRFIKKACKSCCCGPLSAVFISSFNNYLLESSRMLSSWGYSGKLTHTVPSLCGFQVFFF